MPDYASGLPKTAARARGTANSVPQPEQSQQAGRDTSWEARFGRILLQSGMAVVPKALFSYQGALQLSAQDVWFVARALVASRDGGLPRPSIKGIAAEAGMSVQGIRRIRDALLDRSLLLMQAEYDPDSGVQLPNAYDFSPLFARLEEVIIADPPGPGAIEDDELTAGAPVPLTTDNSFVARFGRVIARAGVAPIPAALFTYQGALGLSVPQTWFVMQILSYKWTTALPYPSLKKLASRCGYTDRNLHKIKDELVERGYLEIVARELPHGGRTSSAYDFSGLLDSLIALVPASAPAVRVQPETPSVTPARQGRGNRPFARQSSPTNRATLEGQQQFTGSSSGLGARGNNNSEGRGNESSEGRGNSSSYRRGNNSSEDGAEASIPEATTDQERDNGGSHEGQQQFIWGATEIQGVGATPVHRWGSSSSRGRGNNGSVGRGNVSSYKEGRTEEGILEKEDSNRYAPVRQKGARKDMSAYSPYIAGVVDDYSRELGDGANRASNVSQAMRLWQESELAEEAFIDLLRSARSLTRVYQSRQGSGSIAHKGAYFFRVVESLLPGAELDESVEPRRDPEPSVILPHGR